MTTPENPRQEPPTGDPKPPKRSRLPRWLTPISLIILFLVVHVAAPWGLSLLSNRYGWVEGRPGLWSLLALIPVVVGIAVTLWLIVQHYRGSPETFMEMQPGQTLLTPGLYARSRNPMYLFELVFWFGWALFYGSLPVLLGFLLWLVLFNFVIVPYEERDLESRFGEAYREYKRRVPRWFGKPGR